MIPMILPLLAIAANGVWTCYNLTSLGIPPLYGCTGYSATPVVVNSTGLSGVFAFINQNFPTLPLIVYGVICAIMFIVYATNRGRRSYIGVMWLNTIIGVIMIGAGLLPVSLMVPIWAIFFSITAFVHLFDE